MNNIILIGKNPYQNLVLEIIREDLKMKDVEIILVKDSEICETSDDNTDTLCSISLNRTLFDNKFFLEKENKIHTIDKRTRIICCSGNWKDDLILSQAIQKQYPETQIFLVTTYFPEFFANLIESSQKEITKNIQFNDLGTTLIEKICMTILSRSLESEEIFSNRARLLTFAPRKRVLLRDISSLINRKDIFRMITRKKVLLSEDDFEKHQESCISKKKQNRFRILTTRPADLLSLSSIIDPRLNSKNNLLIIDDGLSTNPMKLLKMISSLGALPYVWYIGPEDSVSTVLSIYPEIHDRALVFENKNTNLNSFLWANEMIMNECSTFAFVLEDTLQNILFHEIVSDYRRNNDLTTGFSVILNHNLVQTIPENILNYFMFHEQNRTSGHGIVAVHKRDIYREAIFRSLSHIVGSPSPDISRSLGYDSSIRSMNINEDNVDDIKTLFEAQKRQFIVFERKHGDFYEDFDQIVPNDRVFFL